MFLDVMIKILRQICFPGIISIEPSNDIDRSFDRTIEQFIKNGAKTEAFEFNSSCEAPRAPQLELNSSAIIQGLVTELSSEIHKKHIIDIKSTLNIVENLNDPMFFVEWLPRNADAVRCVVQWLDVRFSEWPMYCTWPGKCHAELAKYLHG